jgi:magnesium transporter
MGIGALSGVVMSVFAWSMHQEARLGLVVGVSMLCTVVFAALMGSVLPLILKALGKDPSKASEPFLATIMDILGLLIYFLIGVSLI